MSVAWDTIQTAIKTWADTYSGLVSHWEMEPRGWVPKALIKLQIIESSGHGQDYETYEYDAEQDAGEEMVPVIRGQRFFTLNVQCLGRSQVATGYARHHLEKLRTSLKLSAVRAAFNVANFSLRTAQPVISRERVVKNRAESWASMDILLQTFVEDAYPAAAIGYLTRVSWTQHAYDENDVATTVYGDLNYDPEEGEED